MLKTAVTAFEARVYTSEFTVYGLLHLPVHVNTAAVLNNQRRPYLPITQCTVYRAGVRHPPAEDDVRYTPDFVALPKDQIQVVIGGIPDEGPPGVSRESRTLFMLYRNYAVRGEIRITPNARISDYLVGTSHQRPFQNLFEAAVTVPEPGVHLMDLKAIQRHSFVTVNLRAVGGMFDISESRTVPVLTDF